MVDLKKDLDEYLLLKSDTKKSFKINMPAFSRPDVGKLFGRSNHENTMNGGWMVESQKECCPAMSRMQRIIGFCMCMFMGILCFSLSAMYVPVLLLKARKFALLYTLGSLFFIFSFSFLFGPMSHLRTMVTKARLPMTLCYGGSLAATLYFALSVQSTPLTVLFAVLQIIALFWILVAAIPGGATGLKFFGSIFKSSVSSTLPV